VRRNNEELVATYGNLVNRVLSFTYRNFEGRVPPMADRDAADQEILDRARATLDSVSDSLYHTHFRAAISQAFALAQEANRYLDGKAPWRAIKTNREDAANALGVSLQVINCLKVALAPFLPFSSQSVHEFLGFDGRIEDEKWDFQHLVAAIKPGSPLRQPRPLYTKLEPQVAEEETQRLGGQVV
jgi:methionyl-tRNA synthetase